MKALTTDKFYDLSDDFILDLIALYDVLQDKILALIDKSEKEGWTPEELIYHIEELI